MLPETVSSQPRLIIKYHLDKINNIEEVENCVNLALKSRIPTGIKKGCHALDLNLIPYYNEPNADELPYIDRSEAKSGTCSFYAYATLYVIKNDSVTFDLWIICKYKKGKRKKHGIEYFAYVIYKVKTSALDRDELPKF